MDCLNPLSGVELSEERRGREDCAESVGLDGVGRGGREGRLACLLGRMLLNGKKLLTEERLDKRMSETERDKRDKCNGREREKEAGEHGEWAALVKKRGKSEMVLSAPRKRLCHAAHTPMQIR